jgi:hypothetical protein
MHRMARSLDQQQGLEIKANDILSSSLVTRQLSREIGTLTVIYIRSHGQRRYITRRRGEGELAGEASW